MTIKVINISNVRVSMAIKVGRVVTYLIELQTIKSCNDLIKFSCRITEQTKTVLSLLPNASSNQAMM